MARRNTSSSLQPKFYRNFVFVTVFIGIVVSMAAGMTKPAARPDLAEQGQPGMPLSPDQLSATRPGPAQPAIPAVPVMNPAPAGWDDDQPDDVNADGGGADADVANGPDSAPADMPQDDGGDGSAPGDGAN